MLSNLLRRFFGDRRGNVAIIFALSLVPIILLTGLALDFTAATQKRAELDAAADAAALAAVTPEMMNQTVAAATTAAANIFNAQASGISGLTYNPPVVNVTASGLTRTVTVSYTANSANWVPSVLGQQNWAISGTATATATVAPNINFYLLLDNSPSMNIAATTAGINTMVANTSAQGGCAFACHESHPSADNLGNPNGVDNYTLAAQLGVVTRIQNMATATQALMSTAQAMETSNNAQYQMAIYTFNVSGLSTIQLLTSNLANAQAAAANINVLEVYSNNWLTKDNNNNDTDTDFEAAMSQINSIMPNPGTGTAGSTSQEVLFIVTDGVDDEVSSTCSQQLDGSRCQQPFDTTWCTTVKNRGIYIAVLYTVYLPLPTNAWYNNWIAPFQSEISPNLESCASPGLFFSVTTDGDITAAMQTLFQEAIATARLSQ
ncbi:MAG TPA: pilus assembly protein TadG-related protein [Xanthobacteraceae bacterium]|nr:pilus assembly protein TadG-related protein [Xanthobacteraceae bacterium]